MSKEKIENDYQNSTKKIEQLSEEAIKNIQEKASAIKEEAKKIGASLKAPNST